MKKNGSGNDFGILMDKPGKIEHYEKRFGILAIEKGFIDADDLIKALTVQVGEDISQIRHRLLGKVLFDMA